MLNLFVYKKVTQEVYLKKAELDKAAADFALLSEQKVKLGIQLEQVQESLENAEKDIAVTIFFSFLYLDGFCLFVFVVFCSQMN